MAKRGVFLFIDIIGVPIDLGANRRGVDMGPSAIRYAGLKTAVRKLGYEYRDLGNINVPVPEDIDQVNNVNLKFVNEITGVNKNLSDMVSGSLNDGNIPVVLGGDHSIAAGTILGTQKSLRNIGVIWMDAHGDFNSDNTTTSGNLHGMSLAASTGFGPSPMTVFKLESTSFVNPEKVAVIGARSLDYQESIRLCKSGVKVFTMSDIDMYGIKKVIMDAIDIADNNTEGIHLSFDMDVISPSEAPGVGTPVKGGLTYREAHLSAEMISDSNRLCSMEFVEVNPVLDHGNQTGELAVSLICSALGQKILCIRN